MPILVYDKSQSKILAVHSGWRGVANRILIKSLIAQNMQKAESQIQIWVGPHIQAQSFECGLDVAEQILSSVKTKSADMILKETKDKKFLNLANILRQQLLEERISFQSLLISDIDTFSNMNWHSFRREKAKVRQYAYIALK